MFVFWKMFQNKNFSDENFTSFMFFKINFLILEKSYYFGFLSGLFFQLENQSNRFNKNLNPKCQTKKKTLNNAMEREK